MKLTSFLQCGKRAQASFEYIMLVAVIMVFVVSGVGVIYSYSQRSSDDINFATIEKIGREITESGEKIYYVGGASWETLKFNVPTTVSAIYVINSNELVIEYDSRGGTSQAVFYSDINMTTPYIAANVASISPSHHAGLNIIKVSSQGSQVLIEEVTS